MKRTKLLVLMSVFVAIGTIGSQFLWFPAGIARAYPVQHAVNVIAAILLGPGPAVVVALMIGLIRNLLGLGSLLAFPGGMIGALMAGLFYKYSGKNYFAALGEIIGTGLLASLIAVPFSRLLMGSTFGIFFFMPSFLVSSISGAATGLLVASRLSSSPLQLFKTKRKIKQRGIQR